MPCQVAAVQSYINGKKYKKLAAKASIKDDLDKYKQHLVPSNKKGHEYDDHFYIIVRQT